MESPSGRHGKIPAERPPLRSVISPSHVHCPPPIIPRHPEHPHTLSSQSVQPAAVFQVAQWTVSGLFLGGAAVSTDSPGGEGAGP